MMDESSEVTTNAKRVSLLPKALLIVAFTIPAFAMSKPPFWERLAFLGVVVLGALLWTIIEWRRSRA
jgi:hypothetical protein